MNEFQPIPAPAPLPPQPEADAAVPSKGPDSSVVALVTFHRALRALTPRVYMTWLLLAINVLVFVLMAASGVSLTKPQNTDLLAWGANFGPSVIAGQGWRILTSTFVHIGIIHILLNMFVLYTAGPFVERMVGNFGFLIMYLVAGLCGSLASLLWNPMQISAGASGAIFGVYGCLLGLLLRQRGSIPQEVLAALSKSGLGFLVYNLAFGMIVPGIDSAAHLGGLAGGFLGGLVLAQPFAIESRGGRPIRGALLAVLGAALVAGGMAGVQARNADLMAVQTELDHFGQVEQQVMEAIRSAQADSQRPEAPASELADVLENDVLPPWRSSRQRLSGLERVPPALQPRVASLLKYMQLRQESWELFVPALRDNSPE